MRKSKALNASLLFSITTHMPSLLSTVTGCFIAVALNLCLRKQRAHHPAVVPVAPN